MDNPHKITSRYSDADLQEFKEVIDKKMEKAVNQYTSLKEQLKDLTENNNDDYSKDISDFSSIQTEVEMLNNMANRQSKYIKELENALIRIKNKSYGICVVTGELIDKKRLLAVPTTTKSVLAKTQSEMKDVQVPKDRDKGLDDIDDLDEDAPAKKPLPKGPTIITKVIKKSGTPKKKLDPDDELDKIFSDLDGIDDLDGDLNLDDDEDSIYDNDADLGMIADDSVNFDEDLD